MKSIQSVVAMVPHAPQVDGQPASDRFFLVEKPGLDVAVMAGVEEVIFTEETRTLSVDSIANTTEE